MKKTYINPDMEVVELTISQPLMNASQISGSTSNPDDLLAPSQDDPNMFGW